MGTTPIIVCGTTSNAAASEEGLDVFRCKVHGRRGDLRARRARRELRSVGHARRPEAGRTSWPPRTSGEASPPSWAATGSTVTSIIDNPDADPHDYEPTTRRRASDGGGALRDRERRRLRPVGAAAARRQPRRPGVTSSTSATLVGVDDGGNPHRWYSPGGRATGDRRDHARLHEARSRPTLRTSTTAVDVRGDGTRASTTR